MISTSQSVILKTYLIMVGAVSNPEDTEGELDWECYISNMPVGKDNVVAIYDRPHMKDGKDMQGFVIGRYAAQIRVAAADFDTGRAKVIEILNALDAVRRTTISVDQYDYVIPGIIRGNEPAFLGVSGGDTRRNYEWTINLEFHAKELSS